MMKLKYSIEAEKFVNNRISGYWSAHSELYDGVSATVCEQIQREMNGEMSKQLTLLA